MLYLPAVRVIRGSTGPSISFRNVDGDGEPVATADAVTVAVATSAGVSVSGVGAVSAVSGVTGKYSATLPASAVAVTDWLTVTWSVDGVTVLSEIVEVCGPPIGTLAEITRGTGLASKLGNEDTKASLLEARRSIEDHATRIVNRGLFERFYSERVDGYGNGRLFVSWPDLIEVERVTTYDAAGNATDFSSAEVAALRVDDSGRVHRTDGKVWPCGKGNVEIAYRFGWRNIPTDLRRGLWRATVVEQGKQSSSGLDDRATMAVGADGTRTTLATPGVGKWSTGLPDVDERLRGNRFLREELLVR